MYFLPCEFVARHEVSWSGNDVWETHLTSVPLAARHPPLAAQGIPPHPFTFCSFDFAPRVSLDSPER